MKNWLFSCWTNRVSPQFILFLMIYSSYPPFPPFLLPRLPQTKHIQKIISLSLPLSSRVVCLDFFFFFIYFELRERQKKKKINSQCTRERKKKKKNLFIASTLSINCSFLVHSSWKSCEINIYKFIYRYKQKLPR